MIDMGDNEMRDDGNEIFASRAAYREALLGPYFAPTAWTRFKRALVSMIFGETN